LAVIGVLMPDLGNSYTPVVLVNRVEFGVDLPMIGTDSFTAMLEVCAHLVGFGHRRVVYLSGNQLAWQDRERWRGIQASRVLGLEATRVEADGTLETGYDVAEQALVHEPTGVTCFNDLSALGVMSRLRDVGLGVPDDISVVGFDDISIGRHFAPSLTTVRSPREELGRRGLGAAGGELDPTSHRRAARAALLTVDHPTVGGTGQAGTAEPIDPPGEVRASSRIIRSRRETALRDALADEDGA
jgi:LacI family transcriptional regulator